MRIFILSDIHSTHTQRWVKALADKGCEIFLFGLLACDASFYNQLPNVTVYNYGFTFHTKSRFNRWILGKALYFKSLKTIKKKIEEFKPDIVHAHYASSYGLLGALTHFHPFVVSVWGSDVYSYPRAGFIYKKLLQYTLKKTDLILSTSQCMARETNKYTEKSIGITPFGVDTQLFKPEKTDKQDFIIGTVKTLSANYGIDLLIRAFAEVVKVPANQNIRLWIVGDGPDKAQLQELCHQLNIAEKVDFKGFVNNKELPAIYNAFDMMVALSHKESFGVVAIEAMSCGCPVVVSDAEGFCEIVDDGTDGLIVPRGDYKAAAEAIQRLVEDADLRHTLGQNGRQKIMQRYQWELNVNQMIDYYKTLLKE